MRRLLCRRSRAPHPKLMSPPRFYFHLKTILQQSSATARSIGFWDKGALAFLLSVMVGLARPSEVTGFTSSFVRVADNEALDLTGPITVEAWIRPDPEASHDGRKSVVSKYSSTLPGQLDERTFDLGLVDGKPYFFISRNGLSGFGNEARVVADSVPVGLGVWSKVRATFDGTWVELRVNGVRVARVDVTAELGGANLHQGKADLLIGAVNGGINFENFAGDIDEVLLSREVLEDDTTLPESPHVSTDWRITASSSGQVVWESLGDRLNLYQIRLKSGQFVGPLAGRDVLETDTSYFAQVRYRDANTNVSEWSSRIFFSHRRGERFCYRL